MKSITPNKTTHCMKEESYWPECDVEGCENESCNGGTCWKETGYWSVCSKHSQMHREGKPQPKMKQSAIDRENSRDENGYLPISAQNPEVSDTTEAQSMVEPLSNNHSLLKDFQEALKKEAKKLQYAEMLVANIDLFLDPSHPIRHSSNYIKLKELFKEEENNRLNNLLKQKA
jgi:hypothetical protein